MPLPNELIFVIKSYLTDYRAEINDKFKKRVEQYFLHEFAFKRGDIDIFVSYFNHSVPNNSQTPHVEGRTYNQVKSLALRIKKGLRASPQSNIPDQTSTYEMEEFFVPPAREKPATIKKESSEEMEVDDEGEEEYVQRKKSASGKTKLSSPSSLSSSSSSEIESEDDEDEGDEEEQSYYYVKSQTAITFCGIKERRNIQIINCGDRTPEDALMDFDLDCVTFAYDGQQVYSLPRGRRAINTWCNFMDPFVLRFKRSRNRVAKYHTRGFSTILFENCIHTPRCDIVLDPNVIALWNRTKGSFSFQQCAIHISRLLTQPRRDRPECQMEAAE